MSSTSPLVSVPQSRPLDAPIVRVLQIIDQLAKEERCPYFIAGATARDLMLHHVFGLSTGRATRDVDFGLAVKSWVQFARLKQRFIANDGFQSHPQSQQRLTYSDANSGFTLPIDLIPFGGVSTERECIEWPPGRDIVMNVAGFEEALGTAVQVAIHKSLVVPVASVPGLALLKLMAWFDRGPLLSGYKVNRFNWLRVSTKSLSE